MNTQAQEAIDYLRSLHLAPETIMDTVNVVDVNSFKTELDTWIVEMKEDDECIDFIDAYETLSLFHRETYNIFLNESTSY